MTKLEIVFFDSKEYEVEYFTKNLSGDFFECCNLTFIEESIHNYTKLDEIASKVDILSVFTSSTVSKALLEKFTNLKFVATRSTGFSHIDTSYCTQRNIPVANVRRYGDCTIAEFAFGLMLNVARKIQTASNDLKKGIINTEQYIGNDLFEKTIGIIGTGSIGSHSVRIASGFGMNILAYDPYPRTDIVKQYGVKYVPLEELIKHSDYITIHAPSTKENFHLINKDSFDLMKEDVILVNTARGEIVDTEALYEALLSGKVKAAGLDVLECEEILGHEDKFLNKIDCVNPECLRRTLINHKLLDMPNVIVTPHVAFDSLEAVERIMIKTVENIKEFVSEVKISNRVN